MHTDSGMPWLFKKKHTKSHVLPFVCHLITMSRNGCHCPVPGCSSTKELVKLSNHLTQMHGMGSPSARRKWLQHAKQHKNVEKEKDMEPMPPQRSFEREKHVELMSPRSSISWSANPCLSESSDPWWEHCSLVPFKPYSSYMVCGPTQAGKSRWIQRLLQHKDGMFTRKVPQKTLYCYGVYDPLIEEMERTIPGLTAHEGLPSQEELDEFADGRHHLVILDDLMDQAGCSPWIQALFVQGCHHKHLSAIFVTQNMYYQGKCVKTISLNTKYLILFHNVRDSSQIMTLAKQLYPSRGHILMEAYEHATSVPHGYLVVDLSNDCESKYRLRSRIFPGEDPLIYVPTI